MFRIYILSLSILYAPLAHATRSSDHHAFEAADEAISAAIVRGELPGAVLVVGTDKEIVYQKAYGNRAVLPTELPMHINTIFDLASLTKPIACASSIMILVDEGKIDLSKPVSSYLPEFGVNGKEDITVEDLLLHRSGLIPDNPMSDYADGVERAWENLFNLAPVSKPKEKFVYSDVNYQILGELVRRVSGRPLDLFAQDRVFAPLQMNESMFNPPPCLRERYAYTEMRDGHWMVGEVHDPRAFVLGVSGHAGLFATALDVARFCQMLLRQGEGVVSARTAKEWTACRFLPDGSGGRGYGFDCENYMRGDLFAHGSSFGHTGYTGTGFWIDPITNGFLVLLTNRVHPSDAQGKVAQLRFQVATTVARAFVPAKE